MADLTWRRDVNKVNNKNAIDWDDEVDEIEGCEKEYIVASKSEQV